MDGAAGADGDDFCAQPPGHQSCTERAYFVGGLREWSERAARNASSPRRPLRRETVQFLAVRLQDLPLMLTTTGCARVFVPLPRSEEHTSELQSRGHLVCRLLLEKKKKSN